MRTETTSSASAPAAAPAAAVTSRRQRRIRIAAAIGAASLLAWIGAWRWMDWTAAAPARGGEAARAAAAAVERRMGEERLRLEREQAERLATLEREHAARLAAAADAATAAGAAERAALQRDHAAQLAHERDEGVARLAALQAEYERELAAVAVVIPSPPPAGAAHLEFPANSAAGTAGIPEPPPTDDPALAAEGSRILGADLLAFVRSPEVALLLGPFVEPGYAQLDNSFGAVRLPFSLAELRATGALDPDEAGWRTMHRIASSRRDVARTRWASEPGDAGLARLQRAQALLRELGPVLVEAGLLRP